VNSLTPAVTVGNVLHSLVALHLIAFDIVLREETLTLNGCVATDKV